MGSIQLAFSYENSYENVATKSKSKLTATKNCKEIVPIMQAYGTCYINAVLNAIMFSPYLSQLAVAHLVKYLRQLSFKELQQKMDAKLFEVGIYDMYDSCIRVPNKDDDLQSVLYKLVVCKGSIVDKLTHVSLVGKVGYALQDGNPNEGGVPFEIMVTMLQTMKVPFIMMTSDDVQLLNQDEYKQELRQLMSKYDVILYYKPSFDVEVFCNEVVLCLLLENVAEIPRSQIGSHVYKDVANEELHQAFAYIDSTPIDIKSHIVQIYREHVLPRYTNKGMDIKQAIFKVQGNELRFVDGGKHEPIYRDILSYILRNETRVDERIKNPMLAKLVSTHTMRQKDKLFDLYELDAALIMIRRTNSLQSQHAVAGVQCDGIQMIIDSNMNGQKLPYRWQTLTDTSVQGKETKNIINKVYNKGKDTQFRFVCSLYINKNAIERVSELVEYIMQKYKDRLQLDTVDVCKLPQYEYQVKTLQ